MSAAVVSGRISPQLPVSNHSSNSQAISKPNVQIRPSVPPPATPVPLNAGGVKLLQTRPMTIEEEKHVNQLVNDYLTAHVQLNILQKTLDESRQKIDESRQKIAKDRQKIAEDCQKIAGDRQKIDEDHKKIDEDCQKIAEDRQKIAECDKAMQEVLMIIKRGEAELANLDQGIVADKIAIEAGKARIAANNEAVAKYKTIIETGKARIAANNQSYAADVAKIAEYKSTLDENNKVIMASQERVEASKSRVLDNTRNFVKGCLIKVFGVDLAALNEFYKKNEIDCITVNSPKKCFNIDEEGMKSVIIAFAKAHKNIVALNLSFFKDEMKGNALIAFLKALPETGIGQIKMGRPLTKDELGVLETVQAEYKKAGRTPIAIVS